MFFKIGVLKNFAIFTGKHLCWSLFLVKMQAWKRYFCRQKRWATVAQARDSQATKQTHHLYSTLKRRGNDVGTSQILPSYPTNTPRVSHVETTWKRRRFNVEYTWCVYRDDFPCSSCIWGNMAKLYLGLRQTSDMERDVHLLIVYPG